MTAILGDQTFATHRLPLTDAPEAYAKFRNKEDGMIKVVFKPSPPARSTPS